MSACFEQKGVTIRDRIVKSLFSKKGQGTQKQKINCVRIS